MNDKNGITSAGSSAEQNLAAQDKGKGKSITPTHEEMSMDEDDESSDEDSTPEENTVEDIEPEDDDNMEEIDTDNIIAGGRRTRGKEIDFAKAAQEAGDEEEEDEDEDDDDDFEGSDDEMKD